MGSPKIKTNPEANTVTITQTSYQTTQNIVAIFMVNFADITDDASFEKAKSYVDKLKVNVPVSAE